MRSSQSQRIIKPGACRISHGCGGMAHILRGVSPEALRHRVCVSPGMCVGRGLHWRRYVAPGFFFGVAPHGRPSLLAGGWEGERGERHTLGPRGDSLSFATQAGPTEQMRAAMAKAHEGGALTFSVLAVYFGCCLVAADASLCVHLSSVSIWQLFSGLYT